jgi:hypothetical protein
MRLAIVVAALLFSTSARAQMPPGPALVVDARLGFGVPLAGNAGLAAVPSLDAGVRLIDRLQLTLGFGLFRVASAGDNSDTSWTFIPALTVDLVRAHDHRVACYVKAALPVGARVVTASQARRDSFVIGYDAALGTRWAPHPNFALGVEAGVTGLFVDPVGDNSTATTSFYGALVGTFYWGRKDVATTSGLYAGARAASW